MFELDSMDSISCVMTDKVEVKIVKSNNILCRILR